VLIPYPFAGDHQRFNAESLARAGAAVCVLAKDATAERLAAEVSKLAGDPSALADMAERARALGRPEAATAIAKDLLELAGIDGMSRGGKPEGSSGRGNGASERRAAAPGGVQHRGRY
jgi:D-serine deaminase-like pyridoxal phosphate-dependent protein